MSIPKPPAELSFRYIVDDFETAWGALVARPGQCVGGGNFMFALLAMILLEFACRVCAQDKTGKKLINLAKAIEKLDRRYFTPIPGTCNAAVEFTLPGSDPQFHLLGMMFDLIRNGKAHQYRSAVATLSDGDVDMDITGASSDRGLARLGRRRPAKHLRYKISSSGNLSLYIRTDQLFLDIKRAIENSSILSTAGPVADVTRPKLKRTHKTASPPGPHYNFTIAELEVALKKGGHARGDW